MGVSDHTTLETNQISSLSFSTFVGCIIVDNAAEVVPVVVVLVALGTPIIGIELAWQP